MPPPFYSPAAKPTFTIGALAIAARGANAVGAVRLTLAADHLEIELLHVAGFAEGFALGAVADAACFQVPYLGVRGLLHHGRMLYLSLDPALAAPYSRFALVRFSTEPAEVLARAYRARAEARWASYLVPVPLGLLAARIAPSAIVSGWLGRASLGVLVALALFAVLREVVSFRTWGGPISDRCRDAFEAELSRKLGLTPPPPELGSAPPASASAEAPRPAAMLGPRLRAPSAASLLAASLPASARAAIAIVAAVLGVVAAMAFLQRYAAPREPAPAVPRLVAGVAAAARAVHAVQPSAAAEDGPRALLGPRCSCLRADSPLWKDGVSTVSVLLFNGENEGVKAIIPTADPQGEAPRYAFDLAAVNNAAKPQRDLRVTLTFARRNKKGRRVGAVDRGLFWEGALAPGRAVKWHVRAPGTEMRVDASVTTTLEQAGLEPAAPDAFFALTGARFRAVRIHAVSMLAYLRDPRAEAAREALGDGTTPEERLTLARIRRATAPVIACELHASAGALEACVFNGGSRPQADLELRSIASPEAPLAAAPAPLRLRLDGRIPVHDGVRVRLPIEGEMPIEWAVMSASDP